MYCVCVRVKSKFFKIKRKEMNAVCWSEGLNQQTYHLHFLMKSRKEENPSVMILHCYTIYNPQELWKLNIW